MTTLKTDNTNVETPNLVVSQCNANSQNAGVSKQCDTSTNCGNYISKYLYIAIIVIIILSLITSILIEGYSVHKKNIYLIKQEQQLTLFLDNTKQIMTQQQKEIRDLQNTIQQNNSRFKPSFIALITSYQLLTTASVILQTNKGKEQALALMIRAQNQIANFPEFFTINKVLTNNIEEIKTTLKISKEELVLQVKNLNQQIEALTPDFALDTKVKTEDTSNQQCAQQTQNNHLHLQCLLKSITNALQNIVVISKKKTMQIVLTPEQLISLKLNLKIQLSEVEWTIINDQPKVYQATLQQIINTLNTYFANNNQAKNSIVPALQKLQQVEITKPFDINTSLTAIESILMQPTDSKITNYP